MRRNIPRRVAALPTLSPVIPRIEGNAPWVLGSTFSMENRASVARTEDFATKTLCRLALFDVLPAVNQQRKCAGHLRRPGIRIVGSRGRRRTEIGRDGEDAVVRGVERHGSRAALS